MQVPRMRVSGFGEIDKIKARLVEKGFKQTYGIDYTDVGKGLGSHQGGVCEGHNDVGIKLITQLLLDRPDSGWVPWERGHRQLLYRDARS